MKHAIKPHKAKIVALAYSPEAKVLATGAEDGTVFFINAKEDYVPIGFVPGPSAVTAICWVDIDAAEPKLMVGYEDGTLREVTCPSDANSEETFELEVDEREFDTEPLQIAKRDAIKKERDAAKPKVEAPVKTEEGEAAEEEAQQEEEEEEEIEVEPLGAVLALFCRKDAKTGEPSFLVTFAGEPGTVWACDWSDAPPVASGARHSAPVCVLGTSRSGGYFLSCAQDGSVCCSEMESERYWKGCAHSAAQRMNARLSFDDSFLISAGSDENMFVHRVEAVNMREGMLGEATLPGMEDEGPAPEDITDPNTYSIEEAKQKQESDLRELAANEKKKGVRSLVEELREEFTSLLKENEAFPFSERLPRDAFYIDPGLKQNTDDETEERLALAREELAWEVERVQLSRAKLEGRFLKDSAVEAIELVAFSTPLTVKSFRTVELADWQRDAMDQVHTLIQSEQAAKQRQRATLQGDSMVGREDGEEEEVSKVDGLDKGKAEKLNKAQERLLKRQARAKEWFEFNAQKPDDKYEDPKDVEAIAWAETNMGDFSLKTDDDYVVPESQRVNAQKKKRQVVLLDESIHAIKMGFNERFLALRDLKKRMLMSMAADDARLAEIAVELEAVNSIAAHAQPTAGCDRAAEGRGTRA